MKQLIETYLDEASDLLIDCKNEVWDLLDQDPLADDDLQERVDARFNQLFNDLKPLDRRLAEMQMEGWETHETIIGWLDTWDYSDSEKEDILDRLEAPRSLLLDQLRLSGGGQ